MHVRWTDLDRQPQPKAKKLMNAEGNNMKTENSIKPTNTDLYQAVFPVYYLSKLCGLLPVKFVQQRSGRYYGRLNIIEIVYSVCILVFVIGCEIWGLWRDLRDGWENSTRLKSKTAMIVTCSDVLGVMSLTSVSIIGAIFRWRYLQVVMEKLVEVDDRLCIVSPKKTRNYAIILTASILSYLLLIASLDIYIWDKEAKWSKKMNDKGPVNYVPLYFMYVIIMIMEIQYALTTYNLGQRFRRLNKCLEDILKTGKITNQFRKDLGLAGDIRDQGLLGGYARTDLGGAPMFRKMRTVDWYSTNDNKSFASTIAQLVTVHSTLCDIVAFINNAFGMTVLVVILTCLIHLIITPYVLIMEADGNKEGLFLAVQALWCIFHVIRMFTVVQPPYAAAAEARRTAVLVSQLLSGNPEADTKKHLEIFSLQLLHRPLDFSACGLFSLDRALVTSIAGAVTTYLVILIQFQKADDTKVDMDNSLKNATLFCKNASALHNITAYLPLMKNITL